MKLNRKEQITDIVSSSLLLLISLSSMSFFLDIAKVNFTEWTTFNSRASFSLLCFIVLSYNQTHTQKVEKILIQNYNRNENYIST